MDSRLFWPFFNQKQPKNSQKNNLPKYKPFDEISEIWNVDASQQKKCYKKTLFGFRPFWPFFNQKTSKLTKNEENWQNPNRLMKFSEIMYVDASQRIRIHLEARFSILAFSSLFAIFWQKMNKIVKI